MAAEGVQVAVRAFLQAAKKGGVGVVGASSNRAKFGNKVLRAYVSKEIKAVPVNPRGGTIEDLPAVKDIKSLPDAVACISVITPPKFADGVVAAAQAKGIAHVWFQPGAYSDSAVKLAADAGMNVIADGTCVLVQLGVEH